MCVCVHIYIYFKYTLQTNEVYYSDTRFNQYLKIYHINSKKKTLYSLYQLVHISSRISRKYRGFMTVFTGSKGFSKWQWAWEGRNDQVCGAVIKIWLQGKDKVNFHPFCERAGLLRILKSFSHKSLTGNPIQRRTCWSFV